MVVFKIGDKVKCVDDSDGVPLTLNEVSVVTAVTIDEDGDVFIAVDSDRLEEQSTGNWYADRFELVERSNTARQKLDKLKKYFESGNDVPVQQATIKAKDFWAIYNS